MANNNLEGYFRGQQISLQWLPILRALAREMSKRADVQDLRQLFFQVGQEFAQEVEYRFEGIETLVQLEDSLNELWQQINWGWVQFKEIKGGVDMTHQAAPLAEGFGDASLAWSIGLLEGFYERVFKVLGAGDAMRVQYINGEAGGMTLYFRFGR